MKKFFSLLTALLFVGTLWAETIETISFASPTSSGSGTSYTLTWTSNTSCTILQEKGDASSNVSSSYKTAPRWYSGHLITFTPKTDVTITKVEITGESGYTGQTMTFNSGEGTISASGTTTTISGSWASAFQIKMGSQCRVSSVKVTYSSAADKTKTTLTLDPTSLNLTYGAETGTLTATVTPEGGSALESPTITWKSDDESVATVDGGIVTPVGAGTCAISATYAGDATYRGSSDTVTVTVTDNRTAVVSAIASILSESVVYVGQTAAFVPSVTLADGLLAADVTYAYVSADPTTIQITDGSFKVLKTGTDVDITVTVAPVAAKLATYKPVSATFKHTAQYKYSEPTFTPTGATDEEFSGSMTLVIANDGTPTGPIYYTLDGTDPAIDKSNCTLYESELTLTATTTVKARVIDSEGMYSTVASVTYTKVPSNKDAITLAVGQSLSFTNFSGAGSSYGDANKQFYLLGSDVENYKCTGTNVLGNASYLQIKDVSASYITLSPVTAPYGFRMTVRKTSGSVVVYVGEAEQEDVSTSLSYYEYVFATDTATAITIKRYSGTTKISNITFTGMKPSRSVTFPDGDQEITVDGETITKTATVSPAGTATYSSSNTAIATVNAETGEVTAVKGGEVTITATVAADDDYEQSKGSYKVTVNKAASTLAFAHNEETAELVDGTATFAATLTPADGRSVVYSSETATVNASTGAVTLTATGDYVIKANAAASNKYLAPAEASYTLHVIDSRVPVVSDLNLVLKDVLEEGTIALDAVQKEDIGFLSATYTKATGFDGTEVVSFATSDATVLKIENGNEFTALKGGEATVTITVTSGGNKMFTTVEKGFTVTVTNPAKATTELTVMDTENIYEDDGVLNLTYGTPLDLDVSATTGYDGTIGKELVNALIAEISISGSTYTITPLAVGSTTLTFYAPETANYKAAANITLTVNVASGVTPKTATPKGEDYYYAVKKLSLKSAPTGWTKDDKWSYDSSYGAVTSTGETSGTYDLVSADYDLSRYTDIGIDFEHTGKTFSDPSSACKVYVQEGTNTPKQLTPAYFEGTNWTWKSSGDLELGAEYDGKTVHFIFRYTPTTGNNGKWEVRNFSVWGIPTRSEKVTLNASGYATFCSEYPLDFSDYATAEYSAWQVSEVTATEITCTQITGKIKGGQGILLKGTANAEVTLYNAESSDVVLNDNKLIGVLAPTYVAKSTQNYKLAHNATSEKSEFQIMSAADEVIPANSAYLQLPAELQGTPESLSIVFDGTPATSLSNTAADSKAVKTIVNGQLLITRDGKTYNVLGTLVR